MAAEILKQNVAARWQESFNRYNRGQPGISGLMTYTQAWDMTLQILRPRNLNNPGPSRSYDPGTVKMAFDMIRDGRRLTVMLEAFFEMIRTAFTWVEDDISRHMTEYEQSERNPQVILRLIYRLEEWHQLWMPPAELGKTISSTYTLTFQTHLFSTLSPSFAAGFKALCGTYLHPHDSPLPEEPIEPTHTPWNTFEELGLLERYESLVASVLYEYIETHVASDCAGKWESPVEESLQNWMKAVIVPWILSVYARGENRDAAIIMQGIGSRFEFHMMKTLCDLRTREIFDIIIDFPDSKGALQDLKTCLSIVDQRSALVQTLRNANRKRLLHPGADTKLILAQYVQTIKCLRIIDPPGVLLFKVADPIRRYLRERPDTIRSIVANLVGDDDGGDALVDENEPVQPLQHADVDDYADINWEPDPIDAGPEFRTNKPSDVISTLVSIYDSKDLFVKELQVLLAQRLLAISEDNTEKVEKERRNIEILKIRFGESALQVCEVMLRDMTDSKRIDTHIQSKMTSVMHPTVISKHFWPALESSDIVMPGQFQALQSGYAQEFTTFKPDKKLRWLPHLGTVHLALELQDRIVEVDVPPLEAAFIELFSTKDIWTVDQLIASVGSIDKPAALKALATWIDHGVLKEDEENNFRLLEVAEEPASSIMRSVPVTIAEEPKMSSAQQEETEKMRVNWQYIQGMLKNIGQLPLDRIQGFLKFIPEYDKSVEELASFMEAARREGLVSQKDGLWRLET